MKLNDCKVKETLLASPLKFSVSGVMFSKRLLSHFEHLDIHFVNELIYNLFV